MQNHVYCGENSDQNLIIIFALSIISSVRIFYNCKPFVVPCFFMQPQTLNLEEKGILALSLVSTVVPNSAFIVLCMTQDLSSFHCVMQLSNDKIFQQSNVMYFLYFSFHFISVFFFIPLLHCCYVYCDYMLPKIQSVF